MLESLALHEGNPMQIVTAKQYAEQMKIPVDVVIEGVAHQKTKTYGKDRTSGETVYSSEDLFAAIRSIGILPPIYGVPAKNYL